MTTPLFQEALLEVNKLKEIAVEDAKRALVEAMTPAIKKELDRSLSSMSRVLLMEVEDDNDETLLGQSPSVADGAPLPTEVPLAPPPETLMPAVDPAAGLNTPLPITPETPATVPVTPPPPEGMPGVEPPPVPSSAAGSMSVPLPDTDGQIVINFKDLFEQTPEGQDPALGMPTEPAAMSPVPVDDGGNGQSPSLSSSPYDSFKENFVRISSSPQQHRDSDVYGLYEQLISLKESKSIADNIVQLYETRLERLWETIKKNTTYGKEKKMKSLKEFAKTLFEDASGGFGDNSEKPKGTEELDPSNASGKHAISASDSTPVEDPGKKESLTVEALEPDSEGSDDETLKLEAELREMFGSDEDKEVEVADKSLKQEALKLRKENLSKKMKSLKEEQAKVEASLKEMHEEQHVVIDVNVNVNDDGGGMGGLEDLDDDDEIEVVGDDGEELSDDDMDLAGDTEDLDDVGVSDEDEENKNLPPSSTTTEGKRVNKENKALREHVTQLEFLAAKSLYLNKFLTREDLSRTQKRKIVEYLDSARNINEAKEIYGRVKRILEAPASQVPQTKTKATGSSSAPAKPGAASLVTESFSPTAKRWMELAGIQNKTTK